MPELLPDECDCQDADLDILTGLETCFTCGSRRYLSTEELRHREKLEAEWEAAYYDEMQREEQEREQHEHEMRELERHAMEEHFMRHPHG